MGFVYSAAIGVFWFGHLANTWHHGLVARWWSEFNRDWRGSEIEYFKNVIERYGQPALDVGCGTGRILVPCVEAGIEVHGTDISNEMIRLCRARLISLGLDADLTVTPTHELNLGQRYRTIISCGVFGVGTTREEDLDGLRRIRKHLTPGGCLIFDFYLPDENLNEWSNWSKPARPTLPSRWTKPDVRKTSDNDELALQTRTIEFDPMEQYSVREIRMRQYEDQELVNCHQYRIRLNSYFKNEILLMLNVAGFDQVEMYAGLSDVKPVAYEDYHLMVLARA
ncbi:MAG: class I SAM-dependent methyltransferase [Pseudomonadota bacterium]|nr:class I SAM-dependent methyltransferase [Pseudomonadota bacterium]